MQAAKTVGTNVSRNLTWYYRGEGAFIKFPSQASDIDTIFYLHSTITFKHVLMAMGMPETAVAYPEGVNPSTPVLGYLNEDGSPKAVEFLINGEQKFLRNKAWYVTQYLKLTKLQNGSRSASKTQ